MQSHATMVALASDFVSSVDGRQLPGTLKNDTVSLHRLNLGAEDQLLAFFK